MSYTLLDERGMPVPAAQAEKLTDRKDDPAAKKLEKADEQKIVSASNGYILEKFYELVAFIFFSARTQ